MRMKLSAKGRVAPPPMLDGRLQRLSDRVRSWPGIIAVTHWHLSRHDAVDGADFYRGEEELGHIHLDGEVHVVTSPALAEALVDGWLARRPPWPSDDWIVFNVRSDADLAHAEWLMRLAYDQLGGATDADLIGSMSAAPRVPV